MAYRWAMALMLALAALGCKKKEGCTDPLSLNYDAEATVDDGSCTYAPPQLSIHVTHKVGNQAFAFGETYQDSSGRQFQFTVARFYISRPWLAKDGDTTLLGAYAHIVAGTDATYPLGTCATGSYVGLGWDVGIDSVTNHGDPLLFAEGHPLSPTSPTNDHWTWNTGYVFLKMEGLADTSAAMSGTLDKPWELHVATDPLLRSLSFTKAVSISQGQNQVVAVTVDWLKALSGYDFRRSSHTTDVPSIARRAMDNLITGIQIP